MSKSTSASFLAELILEVARRVNDTEGEEEILPPEPVFTGDPNFLAPHRSDGWPSRAPDVSVPMTQVGPDGQAIPETGHLIVLTIGPGGKSEEVFLVTNSDEYPRFQVNTLLYRLDGTDRQVRDNRPAVHATDFRIGGGCDLFPHDQGHPLSVFERHNDVTFRGYPLCQRPNRAEITVWATGTPGDVVRFRLNVLGNLIPARLLG